MIHALLVGHERIDDRGLANVAGDPHGNVLAAHIAPSQHSPEDAPTESGKYRSRISLRSIRATCSRRFIHNPSSVQRGDGGPGFGGVFEADQVERRVLGGAERHGSERLEVTVASDGNARRVAQRDRARPVVVIGWTSRRACTSRGADV